MRRSVSFPLDMQPRKSMISLSANERSSYIQVLTLSSKDILKTATYFITTHSLVHSKLLSELRKVMPNPSSSAMLQRLEELPYLRAVLLEALRVASSFSHRRTRVFRKDLQFGGYRLPAGTVISTTTLLMDFDETVFPDPHEFRPERWLQQDKQEQKEMESRLNVAFGRGTRICPGMNLAWAELYLIVAAVFRRFEFQLQDVEKERDIDIVRDNIFSSESRDSQGMMVKVLRVKK